MKKFLFALLLSALVHAETPPSPNVKAKVYDASGNPISSTGTSLNVNVTGGSGSGNASVSTTGTPVPASATFAGGKDGSGNLQGLTVNGANALKVDGSAVTQPVSGTVVSNAGTGTFQVNVTNSSIPVTGSLGRTWSLLNTTDSVNVGNFPSLQLVRQNDGTNSLSKLFDLDTSGSTHEYNLGVGLRFAANGGSVAAGTSTAPLRVDPTGTTTQPVSGTVSVGNFPATQPVSGTVTANAGTGTFTVGQSTGANLHVDVDNFPGTQPVSGTVTSNQGTSPWVDNVSQFGGSNVVTGVGNSGAGIPRVTVSSDSSLTNITGTVSLPTGASTSANQTNGTQQTQIVQGGNTATVTGASALKVDGSGVTQPVSGTITANAGTGTFTVGGTVTANAGTGTFATLGQGRSKVNLVRNVYSSTNVTTGAYVQLIASTADTTNQVNIFDSSGQTLVLAVGGSGSEVDQIYITPGGNGTMELGIPSGSRVSVKAVSATASVGELDLTLLK